MLSIRQLTDDNDFAAMKKIYNLLALHNDNLFFKREDVDLENMAKSSEWGMTQVRAIFANVNARALGNKLQIDLPEGYIPNHKKSDVFSVLMNFVHLVNASDANHVPAYTALRAIRVILAANVINVAIVLSEYPNYDSAIQNLKQVCNSIIFRQAPTITGSIFSPKQDNHKHAKSHQPDTKRQPFNPFVR